jgi:hypothetical protein
MNFSIEHLLADVPHWRLWLVGLKFVASMERSFKKKVSFSQRPDSVKLQFFNKLIITASVPLIINKPDTRSVILRWQ